ncbi:MAG: peptidylprolyl isomerase [Spirochaetota bacterium]
MPKRNSYTDTPTPKGPTAGRALLLAVAAFAFAAPLFAGGQEEKYPDLEEGLYAELETDRGAIVIDLKYEVVPLTVTNFVGLAEGSIENSRGDGPFYDGLTFHRVEEDFVIQGGDPAGDGSGGPGYHIPTETHESLRHSGAGVVAMANSGPNRNGSQFYITLQATPWLDGNYSIFGTVVRGQDVVGSIEKGDVIRRVNIIRKGEDAKAFSADQASFDALLEERENDTSREREEALARQEVYVERNWPNATRMDNGIRYVIDREGSGDKPETGDTVAVHYTGSLLTGMPFESTRRRDEPAQFELGSVRTIPGWDATLRDMRPGERRTAIVPPDLAFGDQGRQGVIPPNSYLVFEVELVAVNPSDPGSSGEQGEE